MTPTASPKSNPPSARVTSVTDGLAAAVDRAVAAAGGGDVIVVGGAAVVQQCLGLGLVEEVRLHVVPNLLGGGTALFGPSPRYELEQIGSEASALAAHLTYAGNGRATGPPRATVAPSCSPVILETDVPS